MKLGFNDNYFGMTRLDHSQHEHLWFEDAKDRLDWQPIGAYPADAGALALAEPVILRSGDRWVYGAWSEGRWVKVTEGASWPLDHFHPTHWAEPTLDDGIMLGQE